MCSMFRTRHSSGDFRSSSCCARRSAYDGRMFPAPRRPGSVVVTRKPHPSSLREAALAVRGRRCGRGERKTRYAWPGASALGVFPQRQDLAADRARQLQPAHGVRALDTPSARAPHVTSRALQTGRLPDPAIGAPHAAEPSDPTRFNTHHATSGDDAVTPANRGPSFHCQHQIKPVPTKIALQLLSPPVVALESRAHTRGEAANDHGISCPMRHVTDRRSAWDQCTVRGPRRPRCRPTSRSFITRTRV